MKNNAQLATPVSNREMEKRLASLYKRGDAGAMRWMMRVIASQLPPVAAPHPVALSG